MKIRILKLTPEQLMQMLQGKTSGFASNLPADAELLDLKLDLFSKQVLAVVRSDAFEDIGECYPIPEFPLTRKAESAPLLKSSAPVKVVSKVEVKPAAAKPAPAVQASKPTGKWENEFSPEQRKLLSFQAKGDVMVVKPIQFLKEEWEDINEVVVSLGGRWVKGDIISYWEIPLNPA